MALQREQIFLWDCRRLERSGGTEEGKMKAVVVAIVRIKKAGG